MHPVQLKLEKEKMSRPIGHCGNPLWLLFSAKSTINKLGNLRFCGLCHFWSLDKCNQNLCITQDNATLFVKGTLLLKKVGGARKRNVWTSRHVQIWVKIRYIKSWRQELSIGLCMGPIRKRGGGAQGGLSFWGGSKTFLGHFYGNLNTLSESSAQA